MPRFDQREGVTTTFGDDAIAHPLVERGVQDRTEQRLRVAVDESLDAQLRELSDVVNRRASREHQGDPLGEQSAGDDGQRLRGGAIKPVGVVDDAQHRADVRRAREQVENGEPDEQPVGRGADAQAERRTRGDALRFGQVDETVEHRPAQLMQSREWQLHLELDAGGLGDGETPGGVSEVLQQRGLADAGLAPQHEHSRLAAAHRVEEFVEGLALARAPGQCRHRWRFRSAAHVEPANASGRRWTIALLHTDEIVPRTPDTGKSTTHTIGSPSVRHLDRTRVATRVCP